MLPSHIDALGLICRDYPTHRKVVFAPSAQGGRAAADALARLGIATMGLELTTVEAHAAEWIPVHALSAGPPPFFTEPVLLTSLLRDGEDANSLLGAVRLPALRRQVDGILLAGDLDVPARADDAEDESRTDALRALALRYREALGGRLDAAATLRLAAAEAERLGPPAHTVYAAFDEADLGPLAVQFVRALTGGGEHLRRIGFALPGLTPPSRTAAWHFWRGDAAAPPGASGPGALLALGDGVAPVEEAFRFRRAVGAQAEVRDALRDALARGLPLDRVEFALTTETPYLALLHAERDLRPEGDPLPVTFAAGVPLSATRTGQFVRGLFDWLEGGRPVATVVRLLQGDLLVLGTEVGTRERERPVVSAADGEALEPHWAAHRLLDGGLGDGPGALSAALGRAARAAAYDRRDTASPDDPRVADRLDRIARLQTALVRLDALFPASPTTPDAFATALHAALLLFGPEGGHGADFPGRAPGSLSHSQLAHRLLARRLGRFAADPPMAAPALPAVLARAFRDAALDAYVDARAPSPGHLHVVPLSSAGLSGRPHLYVLGLDAGSAAPTVAESALLPDREAARLDPAGGALPTAEAASGDALWFAARALARVPPPTAAASTSVTFCASTLDLRSGDALAPSGLLLRAAALAGHDALRAESADGTLWPLAGLVSAAAPLHDTERDLARRSQPGHPAALTGRFPAAARGLRAAVARAAEPLTVYDGWLGNAHPGIPLSGAGAAPLSITRLETLLACPHRHFLSNVLGARPAPGAPEPTGGLSAIDRGSLLHTVFEAYGNRLVDGQRQASLGDLADVVALADDALDRWTETRGTLPDEPAVRADLHRCAEVFLRSEVHYAAGAVPVANELPFGMNGDPAVEVVLGDLTLPLRGVIDRVDRLPDGTYEIADFKTGSTYVYPDGHEDPLVSGKLQWALYALALEQVSEGFADGPWVVSRAGYRFPTPKAWGERRVWKVPTPEAIAAAIRPALSLAAAGFFPPTAAGGAACRFCDHTRSCGDVGLRDVQIKGSLDAARQDNSHPLTGVLTAWTYPNPRTS